MMERFGSPAASIATARQPTTILSPESEFARLATGTMRTDEMLAASRRIMERSAGAGKWAEWSRAAAYHGWGLCVRGRLTDGFKILEEGWQRANQLDDPIGAGLCAQIGGGCCATLYDYSNAEAWYLRELEQPRSRLVPDLRYPLADLLASARVSQGDFAGAHEALAEFEGGANENALLAYHEGDWERAVTLLRRRLDGAKKEGRGLDIAAVASILGRMARIGNQRAEAETYLGEALAASLRWPDLNRELFTRIELGLVEVDLGRVERAKRHLERCRQIVGAGEDWRGHKGAVACLAALIMTAERVGKVSTSVALWSIPLHGNGAVKLPDQVPAEIRDAIEIFRRYRAPWEESAALLYWSRALLAASHHRESLEKYNSAFAIFDNLGAERWTDRLHAELLRFLVADGRSAVSNRDGARSANIFLREGDYWTISFDGAVLRLRDTVGMHYVRRLIAYPGQTFPAEDLAARVRRAKLDSRRTKKPGSSSHKRRARRARDGSNDATRERARLMVTKRIKDVIAKIRTVHPELARHFATSIRTGYTCTYNPDENHTTGWIT